MKSKLPSKSQVIAFGAIDGSIASARYLRPVGPGADFDGANKSDVRDAFAGKGCPSAHLQLPESLKSLPAGALASALACPSLSPLTAWSRSS